MRSNFKRLGNYIEAVNKRNGDLSVTDLRGLSLTKEFRSSTSNIVGTDMSTYKVMHKYDFAANFMGLGVLVDKAAIVLKKDETPNIVSGAYPVFRVKNENILHPEYLMMWLIRSEFDRYCVFKSDKGIRGGFDWNDLLEIELPIPSITKQREIVKEYNTIQNRIALNQQLIQKLEETAQAIYKDWFVDGIDLENLKENWSLGKLSDLIEIKYGKAYSHLQAGDIPLFGSGGLMGYVNKPLFSNPSVLIPRKGTLSNIMFVNNPFWCVDTMFYSIFKKKENGYYAYYILKQLDFNSLNQGSAVPSMTTSFLNDIDVIIPDFETLISFSNYIGKITMHKEILENEINYLSNFKDLILSKLSTFEN